MIIGISGKKSSGKDLSGMIVQALTNKPKSFDGMEVITEKDVLYKVWDTPTYKNIKFADKLKDIICMLLGCSREQLEDRKYKEAPLPEEWWRYKVQDGSVFRYCSKQIFSQTPKSERFLIETTPRLLLQLMGTECGRQILHPNIWVNAVMANYRPTGGKVGTTEMFYPNWVITDVRFPNELEAVKKRGITIRIEREHCCGDVGFCEHGDGFNCSKPIDNHPSETALDEADFDYTINNNGSIKGLVDKIKKILIKENII